MLAWPAVPTTTSAEDDLEKPRPLLERAWPGIRDGRASLPSFLGDTTLTLRARTHHGDLQTVTPIERQAWASGGWLAYRSGWLLDGFQLGATYYGSAPVYAPADKDGSLLLAPGPQAYHVLGEAFAALRYQEYALLKGYRQFVRRPFINGLDNRMTPNTFEGLTLARQVGPAEYFAGYLTKIKLRNGEQFVAMSEVAGARGTHYGVAMFDVTLKPQRGFSFRIAEQYGVNTFNTFFGQVEQLWPLAHDLQLQVGAQLMDQRAIGDALVARTQVSKWVTRNGAAKVAVTWRDLTLKGAANVNASGNKIQTPWGVSPTYLQLAQQAFINANEKAWRLGVAYDFSNANIAGLTAFADFGKGVDSINPITRARLPVEVEYDLRVDYQPPAIPGLRVRLCGVIYDQKGATRLGYQVRSIVDWEIPLL